MHVFQRPALGPHGKPGGTPGGKAPAAAAEPRHIECGIVLSSKLVHQSPNSINALLAPSLHDIWQVRDPTLLSCWAVLPCIVT